MSFGTRVMATALGGILALMVNFIIHDVMNPVDTTERRYYMAFGGMYCARRQMTACGIRLSNCTDANVYECLHDIHWEDKK